MLMAQQHANPPSTSPIPTGINRRARAVTMVPQRSGNARRTHSFAATDDFQENLT
jgi:hypothetical protein